MCRLLFAIMFTIVFAAAAGAQSTKPPTPSEKAQQDSIIKKDADAETELQKTIARSGNDRAALVRNFKDYLDRFPDAPRKAGVFRAIVESCQQLHDDACALDYAERLIAVAPEDSEMMLLAVDLLRQQKNDASLTRAAGYVTRVLDRVEKSSPDDRPARESVSDWQARESKLRSVLYYLRGQVERSQQDFPAAAKDLEKSYSVAPNALAAELLGEIDELKNESAQAVAEYTLAFVLPEIGPTGKVDRQEVRMKLGNVWRQVHGSDAGLGEEILATFDRMEVERTVAARATDQGATAAARNKAANEAANKDAKETFALIGRNTDGSRMPLALLRGKVVVLSFWATWCGPCRLLEPMLIKISKAYSNNSSVAFLAVNTDEDETQVAPFLAEEKWDIPIAFADGMDDFLKVETLPTVMVFGRDGKVLYRANGLDPDGFSASLTSAIQDALAAPNTVATSPPAN
jgi:thiol-disulfide isomerase/thioredoxin